MKAILKRMLQSVLFICVSVWVLLTLLLYFYQPGMIYHPSKNVSFTPADIPLDYENIALTTEDNVKLHAWWVPSESSRATLLFLHGNAGNISHRLESIKIFNQLGLSVFILDYRGYGLSEGKPSEQGTYLDAEAALLYLKNNLDIQDNEIIIFGRSLGGGVASWLAEKQSTAALIIESTFTSIEDMGKHYYPYLPIKLISRIKYASNNRMQNIKSPLLVIHSKDDDIVPYRLGRELFDQANQPKLFLDISGDHNTGFMTSGEQYINGLDQFITDILN